MPHALRLIDEPRANPLDVLESIVSSKEWAFDRRGDDEMAVEAPGTWCDYSLFFAWSPELNALQFSCMMDMRVPAAKRPAIYELLALINDNMWVGHFGLWPDGGVPMYRHAMLLRGSDGVSVESLEDMVELAVSECERFYPSFQFVIWGGKPAKEAIAAAVMECQGEA
ncbi:MAG: YbjN domain-containing protein [Proteobacteria bacterium]|nr:YbjN domain-containing protein [Pseudomonadota bacterium]